MPIIPDAHKDSLTGFFLREGLQAYLEQLLAEARDKQKSFSIVLVDLDHFKRFNDKYGHLFGDEILRYATSTLRLTFKENQCTFFRYGGDEFIAVFPEKDPRETNRIFKQCNYNFFRRPFLYENKFYSIKLSSGIAGYPLDASTVEGLIQKADEAMYFSKKTGRNRTTIAGRIGFLKAQRMLTMIVAAGIILCSIPLVYFLSYKKIIQPTVTQIKHMKIVARPENLDKIILQNGGVIEGRILSETAVGLIVNIYFDKGEGVMMFKKSEIAEIQRAVPAGHKSP